MSTWGCRLRATAVPTSRCFQSPGEHRLPASLVIATAGRLDESIVRHDGSRLPARGAPVLERLAACPLLAAGL
jgi:hypothetical protein